MAFGGYNDENNIGELSMTKVNLSIPAPLDGFVERQVRENQFRSAEEYMLELVRQDQHWTEGEETERLLLEGLDSGESREMTGADWQGLHRRLDEEYGARPS